jgi:hypothetical protein
MYEAADGGVGDNSVVSLQRKIGAAAFIRKKACPFAEN